MSRKRNRYANIERDLFNLDKVICQFVIIRLQKFKIHSSTFPADSTVEQWYEELNQMIWSFKFAYVIHNEEENISQQYLSDLNINSDEHEHINSTENWDKYYEGMKIFAKRLTHLWI